MNSNREIELLEGGKEFMTPQEYRTFCERMYDKLKDEIDRNILARAKSELDARHHLVY